MSSSKMEDIAEELKISISTVSRVVNGKSFVKEDTRQKVLEALKKRNYVPNEIARSLRLQSSNTIGIIIPDICEEFFSQIIKGIDGVVAKHGYTIIVVDTGESKKNEEAYLDILKQKRVDALVIATVMPKSKKLAQYIQGGVQAVFIDNLPQIDKDVDAVLIDNAKASRIAVEHLLKLGHRDIAVIIGSLEETTGHDRLMGYRQALTDACIPVRDELVQFGNYKEDTGYSCMQALIANREKTPFSAVYVTSEMMTFGAIKAIRQNDLCIPEDISLIGFDVHDKTGLVSPSITTIKQPENQIGEKVGEVLLKKLAEKELHVEQKILLEPYLEENQSCKRLHS